MSDPETQALQTTGDGAPTQMSTREFSRKEIELLKRTIAKDATDAELSMFIQNCKRYGLDPFTGQIHAVKRWDSSEGRKVMQVQVGIDGFRLIADRTGKWNGTLGPYWCDKDGEWVEPWLKNKYPAAAKVGVLRSDFTEPRWGIARWGAYVATKKNGDPAFMWKKMPAHMLAKCAEVLALRSAFPNDLSGLYTDAEMDQAGEAEKRTYDGPDPSEVKTVEGEVVSPKSDSWYEDAIDWIADRDATWSEIVDHADRVPNEGHPLKDWPDEWWDEAKETVTASGKAKGEESTGTPKSDTTKGSKKPTTGSQDETSPTTSQSPDEQKYEDADEALQSNFDEAWQSDNRDWDSISEAQLNRMYAIAEDHGWDEAGLNRLVKDELGYESKGDVPYGKPYDEICEALEDERLRYHMHRDPDTPDLFEGDGEAESQDAFEDGVEDDELPF